MTSAHVMHPQAGVITDIVLLSFVGIRIVLVHGGGPEINAWLDKVGIQPQFIDGKRVTDGESVQNDDLSMHDELK